MLHQSFTFISNLGYICIVKRTLTIILSVLLSLGLQGQGLPSLEKAEEIVTDRLPDGISYYLVKNTEVPGFADFALVQPSRADFDGPRQDLVSLPHFGEDKPFEFLARHGVGYGERGFIRHQRDATIYRFPNVPSGQPAVMDSTLLLLFDIVRSSEYRQGIVISGDINVDAVKERLRILSMTVPKRQEDSPYTYGWHPQDSAIVTTGTYPVGRLIVTYRSPRTDAALMNTIQPVMSKVLANELDIVLSRRLRAAFTQAGIPLAHYGFRYTGSDESAGDELITIAVETASDRLQDATATLAGVLSSLDQGSITTDEVSFARSLIMERTVRDAQGARLTNAQYIDKCISAYLYGSNLASPETIAKTFSGRRIDMERERELLDRYISAMLSPRRNLHIHASTPQKPAGRDVQDWFKDGWQKGNEAAAIVPKQSDTLAFQLPRGRVKLKNTSTDSFSGGKMWTFSNGATVIFKKTATPGSFRFGYMVKGGWTQIQGLTGAESAFVDDVIALEKVAGMSSDAFRDLLAMNGIDMQAAATLTDVRWTGIAPKQRLPLVLKALLAVTGNTSADPEAFARFREEAAIRQIRDLYSPMSVRAQMDSTMSPAYAYATGAMPQIPDDGFPQRVNSYLSGKAAMGRNSLIVLMGDLNEDAVLKALTHALAGLGSSQERVVRPRVAQPLKECWSTTYAKGEWRDRGVTVAMRADWPFSAGSNLGIHLAGAVLEQELSRSLAHQGYSFSVTGNSVMLPSEKISLHVNCKPVTVNGLPAGVSPALCRDVLNSVRKAVNELSTREVSPDVLSAAKNALLGRLGAEENDPDQQINAILYRYSMGRDISGSYKERVKAFQASEIKDMFAAMDGCKCEFAVQ